MFYFLIGTQYEECFWMLSDINTSCFALFHSMRGLATPTTGNSERETLSTSSKLSIVRVQPYATGSLVAAVPDY